MRLSGIFLLLPIFAVCISCSDDDDQPIVEGEDIPSFRLLGADTESVYQYDHLGGTETGTTINLTQEGGISTQILTLRQVGDVVSFYRFSGGGFSLLQRNLENGQTNSLENFYTINDTQSVIWGTNSEDQVFMAYFSPRDTPNLGVRIIDAISGEFTDLSLTGTADNVADPFYFDNRLFITFQDFSGLYSIIVLDTLENRVIGTLDFGPSPPAILSRADGNILVFKGGNGAEYEFEVYRADDLSFVSEGSLTLNQFLEPGPLDADIVGDILYYRNSYAQPALVPYGPATYDFAAAENRILDMIGIVRDVQAELGAEIELTAFGFIPSSPNFLVGYRIPGSGQGSMGGVLVIDPDGQLLGNIELPYFPFYIVKG